MDRSIFIDGAFVSSIDARISVMDRGFPIADRVHQVTAVFDGALIDEDAHLGRLHRSLVKIDIADLPPPAERRRLQ